MKHRITLHPRPSTLHRACMAAAILAATLAEAAPLTYRWTVEASNPQPYSATVMRGETVSLSATLRAYGQRVDLAGADAVFYWQTPDMGASWWSEPATVSGDTLTAAWSPLNDPGADRYTFFIAATAGSATLYRAYGTLQMRPAPGFNPVTLPPPVSVDYATRDWIAAQGYLTAEADPTVPAATNALMAAAIDRFQPKGSYLTAETDPTIYPWAKAPTKPAYTAAEVGALAEGSVPAASCASLPPDEPSASFLIRRNTVSNREFPRWFEEPVDIFLDNFGRDDAVIDDAALVVTFNDDYASASLRWPAGARFANGEIPAMKTGTWLVRFMQSRGVLLVSVEGPYLPALLH